MTEQTCKYCGNKLKWLGFDLKVDSKNKNFEYCDIWLCEKCQVAFWTIGDKIVRVLYKGKIIEYDRANKSQKNL